MKRYVALLLFCCILFVAAGCSSQPTTEEKLKESQENLSSAVGGVFEQYGAWSEAVENAGKGSTNAGSEQSVASGEDAFLEIAEQCGLSVEDTSNSGMYTLRLDLEAAVYVDENALSVDALYQILNFYMGILEEEAFPSSMVTIEIYVDDGRIGSMILFTSAHTGLIGTSSPVITDPDYTEYFEANYNEYLSGTDYQNTLSE